MGAKKKGKKKKAEDAEEVPLVVPDFTPKDREPLPISVRIRHLKDWYIIYTDEYSKSLDIKEKFSKWTKIEIENIKLYLRHKRAVEDETTNRDQQIINYTELFAIYKNAGENGDEWEQINDILAFAGVEVKAAPMFREEKKRKKK